MAQSTLGSYIRSLRIKNGMTQQALAEKIHVTDKAVSKWERDLSYPDIRIFPQLADILGVTVSDLIRASEGGSSEELLKQYEGISDLRAPLHIILGCADLLDSYKEDEEKFDRYLDAIRVSGEYLLSVMNRMVSDSANTDVSLEKMLQNLDNKSIAKNLSYDFKGKKILIAEDIKVNQEIAKELLKPTGAELEFADNGRDCLELVEKNPAGYYDLVLMDIIMPFMNGIEATRKIRSLSDKRKADVPIIAMTANVEERDRIAAFKAGMNAFAEKPVMIDKLLSLMAEFL